MQKLNKLIFSVGLSVCVFLFTIILVGCSVEGDVNINNNSTGNGSVENNELNGSNAQNDQSSTFVSGEGSGSSNVASIQSGDVVINIGDVIGGTDAGSSSNKVNTVTSNSSSSTSSKPNSSTVSKPSSSASQKPTTSKKPNDEGWTGDYPIPKY